jgi:hypothetical protein
MAFLAPEVRLSILALRVVWLAVFMTHAVIGFLLYRWRVLSRFSESSLAGNAMIGSFSVFHSGLPLLLISSPSHFRRISGHDQFIGTLDSPFCLLPVHFSAGCSTCFSPRTSMGRSTPLPSNQSMKPTAPSRNKSTVLATAPCRACLFLVRPMRLFVLLSTLAMT